MALDDRRKSVYVALVEESVLQVLAGPSRLLRTRFGNHDPVPFRNQAASESRAHWATPNHKHISLLRVYVRHLPLQYEAPFLRFACRLTGAVYAPGPQISFATG